MTFKSVASKFDERQAPVPEVNLGTGVQQDTFWRPFCASSSRSCRSLTKFWKQVNCFAAATPFG